MRLITLAPAKVNLVLRVGPLRPDGYHDLASLMVPLDLGDPVDVRIAPRAGPITCRVPGHPELDGARNLAARAADAFRAPLRRETAPSPSGSRSGPRSPPGWAAAPPTPRR